MRAGQPLTMAALESWLARYRKAWEMRDPVRAAELFTPSALYYEKPFDAPKNGHAGIREYWQTVTADQRDIEVRAQAVAVTGNTGIARWSATFRLETTGARIDLDGVFILEFDAAGACTSLREWWHLQQR
jgi:steroid delta-isomerase